jgi:hypothetical protein
MCVVKVHHPIATENRHLLLIPATPRKIEDAVAIPIPECHVLELVVAAGADE